MICLTVEPGNLVTAYSQSISEYKRRMKIKEEWGNTNTLTEQRNISKLVNFMNLNPEHGVDDSKDIASFVNTSHFDLIVDATITCHTEDRS